MPVTTLVRFALSAWHAFHELEHADAPKPRDSPEIRSGSRHADRILLLRNGPCLGCGVLTHRLGVPGQLAGAMRARTGRSCDVDYVGPESTKARSALAWLGDRDLHPYDAVVVVVGVDDAVRRTPVAEWREALHDLVATLTPRLRADATIHFAGIPPIPSIPLYGNLIGRLAEPHRRRLEAATRIFLADLGLPPLIELGARGPLRHDDAFTYAMHAERLAERLAPVLRARPKVSRPDLPDPRRAWPAAPDLLEPEANAGLLALRELADRAQTRFNVEFASVTIVKDGRLWRAMNTDVLPPWVLLELSYCTYTIEAGVPVVVGNTTLDPRFADDPAARNSFINFYAGVPIEDSAGTIIGTFSLHGSTPKSAGRFPIEELTAMAAEAGEALRRSGAVVAG